MTTPDNTRRDYTPATMQGRLSALPYVFGACLAFWTGTVITVFEIFHH